MTVSQLIEFLNKVQDKNKRVLVVSNSHLDSNTIVSAESVEISTKGIPAVYLWIEEL